MRQEVVRKMLEDVPPGTVLRLVYDEACTEELIYLLAMDRQGDIQFDLKEKATAYAVRESGEWDNPSDRYNQTFKVTIGLRFSLNWFLREVAPYLESLEIVSVPEVLGDTSEARKQWSSGDFIFWTSKDGTEFTACCNRCCWVHSVLFDGDILYGGWRDLLERHGSSCPAEVGEELLEECAA